MQQICLCIDVYVGAYACVCMCVCANDGGAITSIYESMTNLIMFVCVLFGTCVPECVYIISATELKNKPKMKHTQSAHSRTSTHIVLVKKNTSPLGVSVCE
jgi:hypothetical protein|mmetsp:Transcript_14175/g.22544  ORF Transcript_14175/g.22544 Transcript_14175/m.22544 type:complete len:101 (+) Transcript_14175:80-382(+)